jgi:hypothetical protein
MTIKFLTPYGIYPHNAIVTLDAATETGLVAQGVASTTTTGGTVWAAPAADPVSALNGAQVEGISEGVVTPAGSLVSGGGIVGLLHARMLAAERGNVIDRLPLTALPEWAISTTVRSGVALKSGGTAYMYIGSGATSATTAPTHTGIGTVADGTARCICIGPVRQLASGQDVPVISYATKPSTFAKRASPIADANRFSFSGATPVVSGAGVLLPSITSKDLGLIVATTPGKNNNNPSIEFITDAPVFYINSTVSLASFSFRVSIEIDGYPYRDSAIASNGGASLKFDFSSYTMKARKIKIWWPGGSGATATAFDGVYTQSAYNVWAPYSDAEPVCAIVGTSLTATGGGPDGAFVSGQDWPSIFGALIGLNKIWNLAQGSAGIISGTATRYSFAERIQDVIDAKPVIFVVEGAHNDNGRTASEMLVGFEKYFRDIRDALPNTLIVVFGTTPELQFDVAAIRLTETCLASACATINDPNLWYIPVIFDPAGAWETGHRHSGSITNISNVSAGVFALATAPTALFGVSNTQSIVVGDMVTPWNVLGMSAVNGVSGTVTAITGNAVTTDIDTTLLGTFSASAASYFTVNSRLVGSDGVHHHQFGVSYWARRRAIALRQEVENRLGI